MSIISTIAYMASNLMAAQDEYEYRRDDLRKKWQRTYEMPRKMKKKRRKHLQMRWEANEFFKPLQF
jgi:hypothetical protein